MSTWFLRAKAWQLFLLIILFAGVGYWPSDIANPQAGVFHRLLAARLDPFVFFAWAWFAGLFLRSILAARLQFEKPFFNFAIAYSMLYFASFPLMRAAHHAFPPWTLAAAEAIGLICTVDVLYALATSLKSAETGEPADFFDTVEYFLGLWLFPVGVWFIQPKINRLYDEFEMSRERQFAG